MLVGSTSRQLIFDAPDDEMDAIRFVVKLVGGKESDVDHVHGGHGVDEDVMETCRCEAWVEMAGERSDEVWARALVLLLVSMSLLQACVLVYVVPGSLRSIP